MQSYIKLFAIVILICLVSVGVAQEAATTTSGPDTPAFPYMAEITGNNLYVRSGPGTNFYYCGKLNEGDKVKVIGKQFSWARIVPPAGSFSWISMQYVSIDPANSTLGTVTGDRVRVYAGSDFVKPLYSTTLQGKLDKGDKVKLIGEQMDDYYKIAPPSFAYLWVSINFTNPIPSVEEAAPAVETPAVKPPTVKPSVVEPTAEPTEAPEEVVPEPAPTETMLDKYNALREQVEAERAKPREQQNYTNMKEALIKIAENKDDDKVARYAAFMLKQVEGFELALAVTKQVQLQNEQLQKIKSRINKARATRLAEFQDLGRFATVGRLQTFTTYGPGHYRIINEAGKTICYALPGAQVSQVTLSRLVGQKVGLVGTIEPHPQSAGALVRFTEIADLR
ncbi:MAG TPA: SH3 domain-containing protein [Sedimentisphaerales bacterium]|nr:SH3 domain-containing protein [Sedimentisphaerales bacterium]